MGPHMKRAIVAIIAIAAGLSAAQAQGGFYEASEAESRTGHPVASSATSRWWSRPPAAAPSGAVSFD